MAPVGSYESLAAAIRAGADAVYFGVGKLNMRARRDRPRQKGGRRRRDRLGHGGDPLRPPDRAGGAHLDPEQHLELRGGALLRPVGRHGGAGARTVAGAGGGDPPPDRRGRHPRPAGRTGRDRDVRPRRAVHVRLGQMLPLALRNQLLGQPRRLPPAVPPQIHRHGQGDGRAASRASPRRHGSSP